MVEFDDIPVRLPSGTKAIVRLPYPFTSADKEHLFRFLTPYAEDAPKPSSHPDMIEDTTHDRA